MQQSNAIFAALIIAWIVFITLRGELPTYLSLLKGDSPDNNLSTGANAAVQGGIQGLFNGAQNLLNGALSGGSGGPQIFGPGATAGGSSGNSLFPSSGASSLGDDISFV